MRKKLTLTIDPDVYDELQKLPRNISVSEVISWFLKSMLEDIKRGGKFSQEEFEQWVESTPEGRDFRDRARQKFGPTIRRAEAKLNGIKEKIVPQKRKKAVKA
jgi:predicted CopG family antitoxin